MTTVTDETLPIIIPSDSDDAGETQLSPAGSNEVHNLNGYKVTDEGVYIIHGGKEKWICSRLDVLAITRNENGEEWGRLLGFKDRDGRYHEWAMPMEMIAGDGIQVRKTLLSLGLDLYQKEPRAPDDVITYIVRQHPKERMACVSRIGWHGSMFILPEISFGHASGEKIVLQGTNSNHKTFRQKGGFDDWKNNIGSLCEGNSRLLFAVSAAFCAPLLKVTEDESGGFHLVGPSSCGKTTLLQVAGSVWGGGGINGFLKSWKATVNGLEGLATGHCDALLLLDEIGQLDPKDAGQSAYMLANQTGKSRADRHGGSRRPAEWRVLFLSTGEVGLVTHMSEGNKQARAGQETRLVDIPAEAGRGMGVFENLHQFKRPDDFARFLKEQANSYFGTAIREFIVRLTSDVDSVLAEIAELKCAFQAQFRPSDASGQVVRVLDRFALVAAAGELARKWRIVPWQPGSAHQASGTCFQAWLAKRGGSGDMEIHNALSQVRSYFQKFGHTKFSALRLIESEKLIDEKVDEARHYERAGYLFESANGIEWLVFPQVYENEICKGLDHRYVTQILRSHGFLIPGKHGSRSSVIRIPKLGIKRFIRISSAILEGISENQEPDIELASSEYGQYNLVPLKHMKPV